MIYSETQIGERIKRLYEENPIIHMTVAQTRPKISVENAECKIIGVYLHIFCVEENARGIVTRHSIRYADILSKSIQIEELTD